MARKKTIRIPKPLLPVPKIDEHYEVFTFDGFIDDAYVGSRLRYAEEKYTLFVTFMHVLRDEEPHDEDAFDMSDGNYFEFDVKMNTMPSSLYSQLIAAVFYGREVPASDFRPYKLKNNFVRLVIAKANGCFLLGGTSSNRNFR